MNDGTNALRFVYLILILLLVVSAFAVRRVPIGKTVRMVLAWVMIFAALFVGFALREDFRALGNRLWFAVTGHPQQETRNGELRVAMSEDGHFYIDGEVNGQPARFLVDTGSSVTTISPALARQANVQAEADPAFASTSYGPVRLQTARVALLRIGPIERRNFSLWIDRGNTRYNAIGMNLLSSLSRWTVEGRTMILRP